MESLGGDKEKSVAVKSRAVVKCQIGDPAVFSELQCDTNLNLPPANWLSEINKRYGIKFNSSTQKEFTSFDIASAFIDYIGDVDVVSDAENIKKLLKIPFSKASVSMLVHRIGKTLLIDDFDICKHLMRAEETEWKWLSQLYQEVVREYEAKEKVLCRARKSRDILQEKQLESKFFCHTIESAEETIPEFLRPKRVIPLPDVGFDKQLRQPFGVTEEENETRRFSGFSRNVEWTFEDIRMLVGSDMPIFGDAEKHPCVSLRLRDKNKPISVLTGMDYWLDNLMCNVPEVVMCCHLGGLVQHYELHKTEDLPKLEGSEFCPSVVRDVARNILTFLKSKATKAGHTYWLFRGKGDDVVKLYDLTSICTDIMDDPTLNPVTVPLGILLYKVAVNIFKSPTYRQQQAVVRTLITSSLPLLSKTKHLDYVTTALYILNDMYVPSDLDPASPNLSSDTAEEEYDHVEESSEEEEESEESYSVLVESLAAHSYGSSHREKRFKRITESLEARCVQGIKYGLDAFRLFLKQTENETSETDKSFWDEEPEMAMPSNPIPMPYEPLSKTKDEKDLLNDSLEVTLHAKIDVPVQCIQGFGSAEDPQCVFLYKFILSYLTLAEVNFSCRAFGVALHNIRMAAFVWELLGSYNIGKRAVDSVLKLKSYAQAVAGDAVYVIMQHWAADSDKEREAYNNAWNDVDSNVLDVLEKLRKLKQGPEAETSDDITFPTSLEAALDQSKSCYSQSLKYAKLLPKFVVVKQKRRQSSAADGDKRNDYDIPGLLRRLGNINNDLGVYYMNLVTSKPEDKTLAVQELLRKSKYSLKAGLEYFKEVNDVVNMALLKSNFGRLLRLRSHCEKRAVESEMSAKELKYVMQAADSYKEALAFLAKRESNPGIWDAVQWELSTTLFNAGCMLQENPPLSSKDRMEIEREIVSLFQSCIRYSTADEPSTRQPLYQYRVAATHHRLGAQYHSSIKCSDVSTTSRSKLQQLAEKHYRVASDMFLEMDLISKFLSVQLERADIQLVNSSEDDHKRLKSLRNALSTSLSCQPAIRKVSQHLFSAAKKNPEDSSEEEENKDLGLVLQVYLKKLLHYLLQINQQVLVKSKKSKKSSATDSAVYKEAYQVLLKTDQKDKSAEFIQRLDLALANVVKLLPEKS